MLMFLLMLGSIPAALALFALGWRAGLLSARISIEPNRTAAGTNRERIAR